MNDRNKKRYHSDPVRRKKLLVQGGKWSKANREKKNEHVKKWRKSAKGKSWYEKYKPKHKINSREFSRRNRMVNREKLNAKMHESVVNLTDTYIRTTLRVTKKDNIPQEIIEAKRAQLMLQRKIKEQNGI